MNTESRARNHNAAEHKSADKVFPKVSSTMFKSCILTFLKRDDLFTTSAGPGHPSSEAEEGEEWREVFV